MWVYSNVHLKIGIHGYISKHQLFLPFLIMILTLNNKIHNLCVLLVGIENTSISFSMQVLFKHIPNTHATIRGNPFSLQELLAFSGYDPLSSSRVNLGENTRTARFQHSVRI